MDKCFRATASFLFLNRFFFSFVVKEICITYGLDAEKVTNEWLAFSKAKKDLAISLENLDLFDREVR
jgi:hypothetical protein